MEKRQLIGLIGVALVCVGVFMPFVDLPIVGSRSYLQNGKGDGALMFVIAAVSLVLILSRNFHALWFTGLASLGTLCYTYINFHRTLSRMKFESLANLVVESAEFRWGGGVLVVGAFVLLAAAAKKPREPVTPGAA